MEKKNESPHAPPCTDERCIREKEGLNTTIRRLARRFKKLEHAFVQQRKLTDRFKETLIAEGWPVPTLEEVPSVAHKRALHDAIHQEEDVSHSAKRSRPSAQACAAEVLRASLPSAPISSVDVARDSTQPRRQSLPDRPTPTQEEETNVANPPTSWRSRKIGLQFKSELASDRTARAHPRRTTTNPFSERHQRPQSAAKKNKCSESIDSFLDDGAGESGRDHQRRERTPDHGGGRHQDSKRPLKIDLVNRRVQTVAKPNIKAEPRSAAATGKENEFQYVEVVRNKEQRAALPGHDCIECQRYYDAIRDYVAPSEMKAMCSRHRARAEPYQTPDDFWRLSFPDSHSEEDSQL